MTIILREGDVEHAYSRKKITIKDLPDIILTEFLDTEEGGEVPVQTTSDGHQGGPPPKRPRPAQNSDSGTLFINTIVYQSFLVRIFCH